MGNELKGRGRVLLEKQFCIWDWNNEEVQPLEIQATYINAQVTVVSRNTFILQLS